MKLIDDIPREEGDVNIDNDDMDATNNQTKNIHKAVGNNTLSNNNAQSRKKRS